MKYTGKTLNEYLERAPWFLPAYRMTALARQLASEIWHAPEPYAYYECAETYYRENIAYSTGDYDDPHEQEPVERAFLDLVWEGPGYYLKGCHWDEDSWLSILDRATDIVSQPI